MSPSLGPPIRIGAEMGIGALLFPGMLFSSSSVLVVVVAIPTFGPRERMEHRRALGLGEVPVSLVWRLGFVLLHRTSPIPNTLAEGGRRPL